MINFKQFIVENVHSNTGSHQRQVNEMAIPTDAIKNKMYFHGTSNEAAAKSIIETGKLKGRAEDSRKSLAPVKDKVYMTPHIHYAQIYAIGGDMAGSESGEHHFPKTATTGHGYVFQVKGTALKDVQPDEDDAGEMALCRYTHVEGLHPHVKELARKLATPKQLRQSADGEYAAHSAVGKKMVKVMPDWMKLHLIDKGAHIAHHGEIEIHRAWKIHKSKIKLLKKDGSNFFEHAEEIPLKGQGA